MKHAKESIGMDFEMMYEAKEDLDFDWLGCYPVLNKSNIIVDIYYQDSDCFENNHFKNFEIDYDAKLDAYKEIN